MPNVIKHRRIVSTNFQNPNIDTLISDVDKLKNNEIKITYFEEIVDSTGTINPPENAIILLDQFEGGVDAYVSKISNGKPTGEFPIDSIGNKVDVSSFDALGNFILTSIPDTYPIALIYIFKIKNIDYENININFIIEEDELIKEFPINVDEYGNFIIENGIIYGTALTPPALTGNTDDLYLVGIESSVLIRLESAGNYELTGLQAPIPKVAQEIKIFNIGNNNITFKHNSASSLAENRFLLGGNKTVQSNEGLSLIYDPISERWRAISLVI